MIPRLKCPNCGETKDIEYSVHKTVFFHHVLDLEVNIDVDALQKDIEENRPEAIYMRGIHHTRRC